MFGCEVFAYPMATIEWRKDGLDNPLPGDDPHVSVQVGTEIRASPESLAHPSRRAQLTPLAPV